MLIIRLLTTMIIGLFTVQILAHTHNVNIDIQNRLQRPATITFTGSSPNLRVAIPHYGPTIWSNADMFFPASISTQNGLTENKKIRLQVCLDNKQQNCTNCNLNFRANYYSLHPSFSCAVKKNIIAQKLTLNSDTVILVVCDRRDPRSLANCR